MAFMNLHVDICYFLPIRIAVLCNTTRVAKTLTRIALLTKRTRLTSCAINRDSIHNVSFMHCCGSFLIFTYSYILLVEY